jgi:ubiquinone/menaquinone biosynthesis C-methylase UbiE
VSRQEAIHNHFNKVAADYRRLRTRDEAPVHYVRDAFAGRESVEAADIGCGAGRYDLLFFQHLPNLHLTCVDVSEGMLAELSRYLAENGINNFNTVTARMEEFRFKEESMDGVFAFNAIHHFDLPMFLSKASRALRKDGWLFIYTRTPAQNAETIWGRHFPAFAEKETRLYELDEIKRLIRKTPRLRLEASKTFCYPRRSTPARLLEQARGRHYSTFSLYTEEDFQESWERFEKTIGRRCDEAGMEEWEDKNVLLQIGHADSP